MLADHANAPGYAAQDPQDVVGRTALKLPPLCRLLVLLLRRVFRGIVLLGRGIFVAKKKA